MHNQVLPFQIWARTPRRPWRLHRGVLLAFVCSLPLVAGCGGAHSVWNTLPKTEVKMLSTGAHPSYCGQVFLTECSLPTDQPAEPIARIDVGTVGDQPTDTALIMLADKARELGANAVIELRIWRQPAGFSWKAPQGAGLAVQCADTNALSVLPGYWR